MATIDITTQSGAVGNGDLQLQNGAPMDGTLRFVTDALNTASPLKLSTSLVQTTSTLKITTNDNPYIDAEDGAGNNRFTVGRDPSSQQVNIDFASNPGGSTTRVGAIRTYRDNVNLSEAMSFIENGNIGIGTTAPSGLLHIDGAAAIPRLILDADTNVARIFSIRTNDLPRWAFRVDGTESGSSTGSDLGIRRYDDTGAFVDTPLFIQRSTGNVGIGTTAPLSSLHVEKASQDNILAVIGQSGYEGALFLSGAGSGKDANIVVGNGRNLEFHTSASTTPVVSGTQVMTISSAGNVGIGTSTPGAALDVNGVVRVASYLEGTSFPYSLTSGSGADATTTTLRGGSTAGEACSVVVSGGSAATNPNSIVFNVASSERGRWTTNGLTFNGDTAAANALDDYEEGTWTPLLINPGGTGSASYGSRFASYTKIGRQVVVQFFVEFQKNTMSGGTLQMSGFPFTAEANLYPESAILIDNLAVALNNPLLQMAATNTLADFINNNGGTSSHTALDVNTYLGASTMNVRGTITYFV